MRKYTHLIVIGILLVAVSIYWITLSPTIVPEDIVLTAKFRPVQQSVEPKFPEQDGYVIEFSLDKKTQDSLYVSEKQFFDVYYYIGDQYFTHWDFFKGIDETGSPLGGENFYFGADGRTVKVAADGLKGAGITISENEAFNTLRGFSYTGEEFPAQVRLYLPDLEIANIRNGYVIYAHFESRFGKDLSWAKLFPIQIIGTD